MPANNPDRTLLKNLHDLAALTPSEAATTRAITRTRAALAQAHPKKNILTRLSLPAGIAALLIVAAFIFFSLHAPTPASAAEQLNAAIETTQAYKGWIKFATDFPADEKAKLASPSTLPIRHEEYAHTDGSFIWPGNGKSKMIFWSIPQKTIYTYDPSANEMHIADLLDLQKQEATSNAAPINLNNFLANQKKNFGSDPLAVKATPDGPLTRFDITFYASSDDAQKAAKEHNMGFLPTSTAVWVNADHLIVRIQRPELHGPLTIDLTYNIPDIHDLYDLGVPRTAKVIDDRSPKDLTTLMDRIDARANKAFGNYTAFLAAYDLDANQNPSPHSGYLSLYAVHDTQWLAMEYRLFQSPPPKNFPGYVLQSAPDNWPNADFEKLLPLLHDSSPTQFYFFDGDTGAIGWYDQKTNSYPGGRRADAKERPILIPQFGLAGKIWPSRVTSNIGRSHDLHTQLIQDNEHPHLLGLRSTTTSKVGSNSIFWLDPTRDDMPIESTTSFTEVEGNTITTHTRSLEFAQLPSGQWYPVHWQEDRTTTDLTGTKSTSTSHYRLQILPFILDNSWFQKPTPKFNSPQPPP